MKLSVSLSAEDVEFLDSYARSNQIASRSAAIHQAVRLLRASELSSAYEEAWQEWAESDSAEEWDASSGDGLAHAPR